MNSLTNAAPSAPLLDVVVHGGEQEAMPIQRRNLLGPNGIDLNLLDRCNKCAWTINHFTRKTDNSRESFAAINHYRSFADRVIKNHSDMALVHLWPLAPNTPLTKEQKILLLTIAAFIFLAIGCVPGTAGLELFLLPFGVVPIIAVIMDIAESAWIKKEKEKAETAKKEMEVLATEVIPPDYVAAMETTIQSFQNNLEMLKNSVEEVEQNESPSDYIKLLIQIGKLQQAIFALKGLQALVDFPQPGELD